MIRAVNLPDCYDELASRFERERILSRIWAHDYTVWKPEPREITNRLGWLHAPFSMTRELDRLDAFVGGVLSDGFEHALLLGMGGSSLAPETFALTFGTAPGYLDLTVLDSTHPTAVAEVERRIEGSRTLFLVATKSGTTTETLSLFRYFYNRVAGDVGEAKAGGRFVAITDGGSPLVEVAQRYRFREAFLNDPNIGGRYAALTLFGLVPAALLGVDVAMLLERAQRTSIECAQPKPTEGNPAVRLGAILAASAMSERDKLTLFLSPRIASFGDWVEQLVAESTGKEGAGILPVVGEPAGAPEAYVGDRLFVALSLRTSDQDETGLSELERAGHPIVRIGVDDIYALGEQFFLWELSTALAGHGLGINPFDQPNVEVAKALAREMVDAFRRTGELPPNESTPLTADGLAASLDGLRPGDYVAIQAFVPPSDRLTEALAALRRTVRDRFRVATTFGYGPRFLHSTGQLHKGDRGNGRFIQFVSDPGPDVPIPDEAGSPASSLTFGALISAEAAGDRQALLGAGRSVVTFAVPVDPTERVEQVADHIDLRGGQQWTPTS
jgi:glucose-6-phosphate isomerase